MAHNEGRELEVQGITKIKYHCSKTGKTRREIRDSSK